MNVTLLKDYQIAVNEKGELLLVTQALPGMPELPCIYYNGGEHALLMRSAGESYILSYLPEALRVPLGFSMQVWVKEVSDSGEEAQAYTARLHFAQDIPALKGIESALARGAA